MKTKELIAELQRLDPSGEHKVCIPVGSYTSKYPHEYIEPFTVDFADHMSVVRIYANFPEGFVVSRRKVK